MVFPPVAAVPGIYRFTVRDGSEVVAEYIGQAKDSLVKRFRQYRRSAMKPEVGLERLTTRRNAHYYRKALIDGRTVSLALVDEHPDGRARINLADKALRDNLETALIRQLCESSPPGVDVLNRRGNRYAGLGRG